MVEMTRELGMEVSDGENDNGSKVEGKCENNNDEDNDKGEDKADDKNEGGNVDLDLYFVESDREQFVDVEFHVFIYPEVEWDGVGEDMQQ